MLKRVCPGCSFKIVGYCDGKLLAVQKLIESGNMPGLSSLMAVTDRNELTEDDRFTSWAFIYWSQHSGRKSQRTFKQYLRAVKDGKSENVDIEKYLQMTVADFEKRWKEWLLRQEVYLEKGTQENDGGRK